MIDGTNTQLTYGERALLELAKDGNEDALHAVLADPDLHKLHMATVEHEPPPRNDTRYGRVEAAWYAAAAAAEASKAPHGIDAIRAVVRDELRTQAAATVEGQAAGLEDAINKALARRDEMIANRFMGHTTPEAWARATNRPPPPSRNEPKPETLKEAQPEARAAAGTIEPTIDNVADQLLRIAHTAAVGGDVGTCDDALRALEVAQRIWSTKP